MTRIKMLAGVEKALNMREMFKAEGYRTQLDIGENYNLSGRPGTVARLFVMKDLFFRGFYFYEDGTYFSGSN